MARSAKAKNWGKGWEAVAPVEKTLPETKTVVFLLIV
jgi:hypothetical protein